MRRMTLLGCALLSCGSPSTARAELMAWQGTLSIALVGSPPLSVDVGGVAVAIDTGNGVTLRTLRPLGTSGGTATFLITDPEAIGSQLFAIQLQVDEVGFATLSPFNPPVPSTQLQLDWAELPLRGILRFCFLSSSCGTGLDVPLSIGHGSSGVGVGGTLTGSYAGESLSIEAAPWTVRTASLTAHTESGALVTLVTQGSLHGANSFTGTTAITGGELSLVTPLRLIASGGPPTPAFARLSMRFVPEPELLLLLGAGVSGLGCLRKLRGRGGA